MITAIRIPVHSFVDVITNSSSEIFVSATKNTVKATKEVINLILKSQGVKNKTADDLFDIRLSYSIRCEATDYDWKEFATEKEREDYCEENEVERYDEGVTCTEDLVIEPKDTKDNSLAPIAAAIHRLVFSTDAFEGYQ